VAGGTPLVDNPFPHKWNRIPIVRVNRKKFSPEVNLGQEAKSHRMVVNGSTVHDMIFKRMPRIKNIHLSEDKRPTGRGHLFIGSIKAGQVIMAGIAKQADTAKGGGWNLQIPELGCLGAMGNMTVGAYTFPVDSFVPGMGTIYGRCLRGNEEKAKGDRQGPHEMKGG